VSVPFNLMYPILSSAPVEAPQTSITCIPRPGFCLLHNVKFTVIWAKKRPTLHNHITAGLYVTALGAIVGHARCKPGHSVCSTGHDCNVARILRSMAGLSSGHSKDGLGVE